MSIVVWASLRVARAGLPRVTNSEKNARSFLSRVYRSRIYHRCVLPNFHLAYIDILSFSLVSLMMLADARPLSALNYIIRDLIYRYTLLRLPEQQHCDVCCTLIAFAGSGKPSSGSSRCNRARLAIALRKVMHLLQRSTP